MTLSRRRRGRILGCAAAVLAAISALAVAYFLRPPSALDFRLHRAQYEAIVRKVKMIDPTRVDFGRYWLSDSLDPESLRMQRPATGGISVHAARDAAGSYEVTITTTDEGHLGYLGYIYSDDSPPSRAFPIWPMSAHWWAFHDNTW